MAWYRGIPTVIGGVGGVPWWRYCKALVREWSTCQIKDSGITFGGRISRKALL